MAQHPFTQDVRASLTLLITDDILTNNRVVDPGDPSKGISPTYAPWDDTISEVRFAMFRDPNELYMYVPVGTRSTENRLVDEQFVTEWMKGKRVVLINDYYLMTLDDDKRYSYQSNRSFERLEIGSWNCKWRGYNMVSQWYWLSDTDMLDEPEFIECASWSISKPDISALSASSIAMLDGQGVKA